jgi:hypothetical protein
MDQNGSITQGDADRLKIKRLASRICELKQRGHKIITDWDTGKNEYGPWRCARYRRA